MGEGVRHPAVVSTIGVVEGWRVRWSSRGEAGARRRISVVELDQAHLLAATRASRAGSEMEKTSPSPPGVVAVPTSRLAAAILTRAAGEGRGEEELPDLSERRAASTMRRGASGSARVRVAIRVAPRRTVLGGPQPLPYSSLTPAWSMHHCGPGSSSACPPPP
jgi:hypothetical protein